MKQKIGNIALVVNDYDEAIDFYVNKLKFDLIEDTKLTSKKRWVLIAPKGSNETRILLAKADSEEQINSIGNQSGGRVFMFLFTDNFEREFENLKLNNVTIVRKPVKEPYGKVLVFSDLYGNLWDLIQPKE
ncbi:Catechol 2,3-dioxygenase [Lutibacter oricola]|uniref:Catechol 2,3-dioxygenase n=1 Tax=Lutibacter oricola TaxID=762486 RepID=A0A1H2RRC2_9FLAO|nr:VOC family protein [Lutibacter oricola]SDW21334.1 Catechol 2,3-dioxygenase [Lutibacter oricola]